MSDRPWEGRRLHLVGIGGAGMSALALVARELGAAVTGSDRAASPYAAPLEAAGIAVAAGHDEANVPEEGELVVSSAIPADNPERRAARRRGMAELHRSDLMAQLAGLKRCLAVTGTHGKSTLSAMAVHALRGCGLDPAYLVGARLLATGRNGAWGTGEWMVVEADESDRSLLALSPDIAVLTSAELDHHATYATRSDLEDTLRAFLARSRAAVVWDRPELLALARPGSAHAYDAASPALDPGGSRFAWRGLEVRVPVPGAHNAVNAAGALEACALAGADPGAAAAALADFPGTARRLQRVGATRSGAQVYDDYAHHPTEVAATLRAARTLGARRLAAVFQPHLYSRTAALAREFGRALALADLVVVLDVYPARERAADWPGVSGYAVAVAAADAAGGRPVAWMPSLEHAASHLRDVLRDGDLCVLLGAGDVDRLAGDLVAVRGAGGPAVPGGR